MNLHGMDYSCRSADLSSSLQGLNKQLKAMSSQVNLCKDLLGGVGGQLCGGEERALMEDTLEGLQERMGLLDSALDQHCDGMRDRLQEHTAFQVRRRDSGARSWILAKLASLKASALFSPE